MAALACGAGGSTNSEAVDEINNSIKDVDLISGLPTSDQTIIGSINVLGYNAINDGGGDIFNWDSTIDKSTANGVKVFDPDQTLANQGSGVGTGCWIRQNENITVEMGGAIGDGISDDDVSIQKVLNLKGKIFFTEGKTYLIGTKLNIDNDTIINGYGATIKLDANVNDTMLEADQKINIEVHGLTLDGNKANQTIFGPLLGIYFQDCINVKVIDCTAHDVYGIGFAANVLNNGYYRGNTAFNNADNGFDFNGDFVTVARTNQGTLNTHIEGNTAYSNGADGFFVGHGITSNNTISNNISYSNTKNGFQIGESSAIINALFECVHNTITGNAAKNNLEIGLVGYTLSNSAI